VYSTGVNVVKIKTAPKDSIQSVERFTFNQYTLLRFDR
jgi:hypothetical protein